jgi:hypothetical protein
LFVWLAVHKLSLLLIGAANNRKLIKKSAHMLVLISKLFAGKEAYRSELSVIVNK